MSLPGGRLKALGSSLVKETVEERPGHAEQQVDGNRPLDPVGGDPTLAEHLGQGHHDQHDHEDENRQGSQLHYRRESA